MPAVQDIRRAMPQAQIDWVVERGFSDLVERCAGVNRVIACDLRSWKKTWWTRSTRLAWAAFKAELSGQKYDAVIDCQGLTKSAVIARCASLNAGGKRFALANRTDGSAYEAPTRWLADVAVQVAPHTHAVERTRWLCAQALGYAPPTVGGWFFGLKTAGSAVDNAQAAPKCIAFIHGTSRADKCWNEAHWLGLGQRMLAAGYAIALLHGSADEEARSHRMANALGAGAHVWPRLPLGALTDRLARCAGAIGVDSGLSHIAVALDLPHVQMYNFDTAWRTGPFDVSGGSSGSSALAGSQRQISVFASGQPSLDQVWAGWLQVSEAAANQALNMAARQDGGDA